jgi:geranylgeranyl diphosphate synthase type I
VFDYLKATRPGVAAALREILCEQGPEWAGVSDDFGSGTVDRLDEFSARGKMIRGCLVRLGYELGSGRPVPEEHQVAVNRTGAAMELFQSGLLVHDDIMDRDRIRRGYPTMHTEYEEDLQHGGYSDPAHNAEALGICMGDLAFFAAFRVLAELPIRSEATTKVCTIAARELAIVGIAQMQDVANGSVKPDSRNPFRKAAAEPDEAQILRLYRYKTGRYTFSLPMSLGAALAGTPDETISILEETGEHLGILFQIKDDELGLFADQAELGKTVGADIREDKKTLYRQRLFARADPELTELLGSVFGHQAADPDKLSNVRLAIDQLGIRAELAAMMNEYAAKAETCCASLLKQAPLPAATALRELVAYSLSRTS